MPVHWEATASALDALVAKAVVTDRLIEADGAKLVQTAMMLRAPHRSGRLRGGISIGAYAGYPAVGPTGPYARRISIGFHSTDRLGRRYSERGNAYASGADKDSAPLVRQLAITRWRATLGG